MNLKFYLAFMLLFGMGLTKSIAQTDYQKIITAITNDLQQAPFYTSANTSITNNMPLLNSSGQFTDLVYGTTSNAANDAVWVTHLKRLREFARGYTYPNSPSTHYAEPALFAKIVLALQYFNSTGSIYTTANWWERQIDYPQIIGQALILMRGGSSTIAGADENNALNYLAASRAPSSMTGANCTDIALHYLYRGALTSSSSVVSTALTGVESTLVLENSGVEGVNHDYEFLQHGPAVYTHSYGTVWIEGVYKFIYFIKGTSYVVSKDKLDLAYNFLHNTYYGAARGKYKDFSLDGRAISRVGSNGAISLAAGQLALQVDSNTSHIANLTADVANFNTGTISSTSPFVSPKHIHYWTGDYTLHNRPGYQFTLYGVSTRTMRVESINNENIIDKFGADGATTIRVKGDEYFDIFPVWDWNQVPGITMRQFSTYQTNNNYGVAGSTTFVGGVSDSTYGASTYQLNYVGVTARKSVFFFDNEVVCLGAGITSTAAENIATNVNQTTLSGSVSVNNGTTATLAANTQNSYNNTLNWAWHNSVGYFFPNGGNVKVGNQTQSGKWADINLGASATVINKGVFKLYFDHGIAPSNATYSYIVVPNITSTDVATYNTNNVKILSNTANIQAVKQNSLNIIQVIFAAAGTLTDSISGLSITVDQPCALMVKNVGASKVTISLSDPRQTATNVKVSVKFSLTGQSFPVFVNTPAGNYKGSSTSFDLDSTITIKKYAAIADAYVNGGASAANNFGTATTLVVKNTGVDNSTTRETYLKFDMHGLGHSWTNAKLRLYGYGNTGATSVKLGMYAVATNAWTETGITYNNRPATTVMLDSLAGKTGNTYREWKISDAIKAIGTDSLISFKIVATSIGNSTSDVSYSSRESSNPDQRPYIIIDSVPYAVNNTVGAIADAYVTGGASASTNYGTSTGLVVKNSGVNNSYTRETYLKFDMHGVVPTNLANAKLKLYGSASAGAASVTWSVFRVTDNTWTETGITYANKPAVSVRLDSIPGNTGSNFREWDITSAIKSLAPDSILSLKVLNTTVGNSTSDVTFSSRESAIADNRPKIVLSIGTGAVGVINYQTTKTKPLTVERTDKEETINTEIVVHQALSPNGDGINDFLQIDGLENYFPNHLLIVNSNGTRVFVASNYDNKSNVFTGKSNQSNGMLPTGTYFYVLDYNKDKKRSKLTGFIVLKY